MTFKLSRKIVFWHSKSYFDIRTESENHFLSLKTVFWHSNWVGKCHFYIRNPILTFEKLVGKSYFDIHNPILPFELIRKMLFWHSKSYFYIQTETENHILTFEILFWHSKWVGKWYWIFLYSKSYFDIRTESENRILTFEILLWHSNWVGNSYCDIRNPILTFKLSLKIIFFPWKPYYDIRTESENAIIIFEIVCCHSKKLVGKSYLDIQNPILTFELSRKIVFWHS